MRFREKFSHWKAGIAALVVCASVAVSSCNVSTWGILRGAAAPVKKMGSIIADPFDSGAHFSVTRAVSADTLIRSRVRPVTAVAGKRELTLEDCVAIAISSNLDREVARLDELTKRALELSSKSKLLPQMVFTGQLSQRDNPQYSYSDVLGQEGRTPDPVSSGGGTGVTNYSTSHERSTWRYVLETRWSPTDAALAYYLSRSGVNDTLKAYYQKARVGQKLVGLVEAAFYRILSLQKAMRLGHALLRARTSIADRVEELYNRRLKDIDVYRKAQRDRAEALRLVSMLKAELNKQRNILASAMSVSPDECMDGGLVAVGPLSIPSFRAKFCDMELTAVKNRPEAYQAGLTHLNSINDLRRTVVKQFPKLTGYWKYTRDKDKYLMNKDWKEIGVDVRFDLMEWLSSFGEFQAAQVSTAKTKQEMATIALGIASEVRFAGLKYFRSLEEAEVARERLAIYKKVLKAAKRKRSMNTLEKLTLDEAECDVLNERIELARALGEANATLAELKAAMGTNFKEAPPCR